MFGVGKRLVYPSFNNARIQYLTGLTHGHYVLYAMFKVPPVSYIILSDALDTVYKHAGRPSGTFIDVEPFAPTQLNAVPGGR